jgi:hypothetical protein
MNIIIRKILEKKISEKYIIEIIMNMKEDMELWDNICQYRQICKRKKKLIYYLSNIDKEINDYKEKIKKSCNHNNVTKYIFKRRPSEYLCHKCYCVIKKTDMNNYQSIKRYLYRNESIESLWI